jgi:GT2 family glycosyltransferase
MNNKSEKTSPLVALVVPVHNNKEDTIEFLESLKNVTYPNYKIVIVDDGSTDGTDDIIQEKYPYVLLLKSDGTLWWTRSFNYGVKKAIEINADYVLQVDNDIVVDPGFISALVNTAKNNPRSIVASKTYYYYDPKRISEAGCDMNWVKGGFRVIGRGEIDNGRYETQRDLKCTVHGFLTNVEIFKDIGMLDEKLPHVKSDWDFTYRAYRKGYRIIYEPRSKIWHKVSSTAKKKIALDKSFIKSPISTLDCSISSKSRGGPLSLRELVYVYRKHFSIKFLYIVLYHIVRRIIRELKVLLVSPFAQNSSK